jgi:hypothetical protein
VKYRNLEERLIANSVPEHTGHLVDGQPSECWLWIGNVDDDGYGRVTIRVGGKHKKVRAHRAAAAVFLGVDLIDGLTWDHHCRQVACIHPNHGEPVPNAVNAARMQQFWRNYRAEQAGQQRIEA